MQFPQILSFQIFLLCLFLITGCDDEELLVATEVDETSSFTEHPSSVDPYRRVFNMHRVDDRLVVQGEGEHLLIEADGQTIRRVSRTEETFVEAISDNYRLRRLGNRIELLGSGFDEFSNMEQTYLSLWSDESEVIIPADRTYYWSSVACIGNGGKYLVPFILASDPHLKFAVGQATFNGQLPAFGVLTPTVDTQTVVCHPEEEAFYPFNGINMIPVESGFLFSRQSASSGFIVERISNEGEISEVLSTWTDQVFNFDSNLYATHYQDFGILTILRGDARGENWTQAYSIPNPNNQSFKFFPVGSDLFISSANNGLMYHVTEMSADRISFEALDLANLSTYTVTDVKEHNGTIYIGTLSGLFTRDYNEFRGSRAE